MPARQTRSVRRGRPPCGLGKGIGRSGSIKPHKVSGTSAAAMSRVPQRAIKCRRCYHGTRGVLLQALNKTAPPVHGADGTQSIRTRLNPAKHYQAAKNQTDARYKTLVGRVIAISRTRPWLAAGLECRPRHLS